LGADVEFVVKIEGQTPRPLDAGLVAGVAAGITAAVGLRKFFKP
jgi:hypothetical protein